MAPSKKLSYIHFKGELKRIWSWRQSVGMDITILQTARFHNTYEEAKHDKLGESKQTDIDMH